ncbi:MAG: MEDS domain-containing protein [Actinomycetota bacterium]|nr:MEDS domain-containing protein [Actinomycetota bacterium]
MYRITRRELRERLQQLQQTPLQRVLSPLAVQGGRGLIANEPPPDNIVDHGHPHFVGFYETAGFLVNSVRDFLTPGLLTGGAAIVVATEPHRDSFDRALMEAGIEVHEMRRCGWFIELDAFEVLATFMVDGMPDAARFRASMEQLVFRAVESARDVKIYGEMVAVLWDEGNVAAAIELEDLWNDLATRHPFSLFCAYPMCAFDADASTEAFRRICRQHSRVLLQGHGT